MNRSSKKKSTGNLGSTSGHWVIRGNVPQTGSLKSRERRVKRQTKSSIFIGPSVEGTDKKYVKVISGSVDDKKPSFA
ncbi:hypothetical protein [Paenibacillus sp. DMB20]|uniref:hypothetical protein n=1 Tax=Paenibacillus sp. DMB20 TaxID=1642570 RepID=UPI000627EF18|nr:hypothetical protein [Paenibacillus sp. DMB20]KKO52990.1 hypothetical protein XI25_17625 [Paenibacillus sp. DMB20]KKO53517.1 hypothetical protein XI25_10845 [Paenibacillus sp. DMB20]